MSAQQIRQRIEQILQFMDDGYWDFVNCHMVNFLTHNHWKQFVPEGIQNEVKSSSTANTCIEELLYQNNDYGKISFPNVSTFLNQCRQHSLDQFSEIVINTQTFYKYHNIHSISNSINVKEFLTNKKVHEVETMAEFTNNVMKICSKNTKEDDIIVIDIGDGKGYLSSRLALQYNYKVVGIDQNENNSKNALERNKKLQRVWPALVQRAKEQNDKEELPTTGKYHESTSALNTSRNVCLQTYTTISKFVTPELDVCNVLNETLPDICAKHTGIVGLHTCGNLASTCLRLFKQPQCIFICNVGCCYHLLDEFFLKRDENIETESISSYGFPMSKYLQDKKLKIGRNARMLASQSIERTLNAKELPNISLFYRALLELLIASPNDAQSIKIGKIKKYSNFKDYAVKSGVFNNIQIDPNDLDGIEHEYLSKKSYLDLFYLIRMNFAPILESLILLDRVLYLKELGYECSYIVSLFDPVISPRRFAIVSIKNTNNSV